MLDANWKGQSARHTGPDALATQRPRTLRTTNADSVNGAETHSVRMRTYKHDHRFQAFLHVKSHLL